MFFMLPLHSLLRTTVLSGLEEAFFERIYINREVVQEARHVAICVLGRINEPINSSSEVMGNGTVSDCFLGPLLSCFQFVFFTIKSGRFVLNRLFRVWAWSRDSSAVFSFCFLPFKLTLQWRVWSWLRMNAGYRLNTCKSRGNDGEACFLGRRPAHGWVTRIQPASDWGITRRKSA